MEIWKSYKGLECGINNDGYLFLGDNKSGYNMIDTPENRETILKDFEHYAKIRKEN